jgi:hypothetical protein
MDLQYLIFKDISNVGIIAFAAVSVVAAYKFYVSYTEITLLNRVRQVEAVRAQDGLPSEVTITPEDLRLNPELADILEITDLNNNVNVALETNAHLEYIQFQETMIDHQNFLENLVVYIYNLHFLEDFFTFISLFVT